MTIYNRRTVLKTGAAFAGVSAIGMPSIVSGQTDKIKIGGVFSVTGGGAVITFSALAGAKMAVAEINKAGGILGKQVDFVVADDRSDPTQTTMETRRLVQQEKVQMLVGPIGSVTTLASIPVLNEAKVASIGVAQAREGRALAQLSELLGHGPHAVRKPLRERARRRRQQPDLCARSGAGAQTGTRECQRAESESESERDTQRNEREGGRKRERDRKKGGKRVISAH